MNVDERRLRSKLAAAGLELRRLEALAVSGHAAVYRLVLQNNGKAKLRVYPSARAAALVYACLGASTPGLLPRPLVLDGRRLIVEFVEGTTLDRVLRNATPRQAGRWVAATGRLLARLHASPLPDVPFSPVDAYVRLRDQTLRR
ncbi:MAG TPA: phosphotransferase, partial [Vicinamibacterales bacterium]|nr:phosphotransferase [Vicinamibacterales bacterium]